MPSAHTILTPVPRWIKVVLAECLQTQGVLLQHLSDGYDGLNCDLCGHGPHNIER
jgi:hypothetical protein